MLELLRQCARLVMTEQLRRPTPELPCALKDAIAVRAWEYGATVASPYRSSRTPALLLLSRRPASTGPRPHAL